MTRPPGMGLVRRNYAPRMLGIGLGSICICAALIQQGSPPWSWAVVIANGLLWPHLAYQWARRSAQPRAAEQRNLMLDSVMGGFWAGAIGFNVLPSVLLIMMLAMDNVAAGGLKWLARGTLAQLLGLLIGSASVGFQLQPETTLPTLLACLPFLVVYPLTLGWITHRLSVQLSEQKKELEHLSRHDALSGAFGRAYFDQRLEQEFALAQRRNLNATLVLADIDHFKRINDQLGHVAGDDALRAVGALLRECVRHSDVLARYGGDEFAIVLIDATPADALLLVERVRAALQQLGRDQPPNHPLAVTMSFGIAALQPDHSSPREWIEQADAALYRVKRAGRDHAAIYQPTPAAVHPIRQDAA